MNTLAIAKKLESVGFSSIQAETLAQIQEDGTVTKEYLMIQMTDIKMFVKNMESSLIKWMIGISFAQLAVVFTVFKYMIKT